MNIVSLGSKVLLNVARIMAQCCRILGVLSTCDQNNSRRQSIQEKDCLGALMSHEASLGRGKEGCVWPERPK